MCQPLLPPVDCHISKCAKFKSEPLYCSVDCNDATGSFSDDLFLLRFLRVAKFSQLRAQEILENYWIVRTVPGKGVPEWFGNMDPADPENERVLDMG